MSEEIKESEDLVAQFLAKGGVIQYGAFKESGRVEGASSNPWSRKPGRPSTATIAVAPADEPEDTK